MRPTPLRIFLGRVDHPRGLPWKKLEPQNKNCGETNSGNHEGIASILKIYAPYVLATYIWLVRRTGTE